MKNIPTYIAIFSLLLLLPGVIFAVEGDFIPLVGLPYIGDGGGPKHFGDYVKALYYAAISIGALLAVIKIIFAGVKYMLTDVVTAKGAAKKDIYGALLGLFIVIGAVLILQTINPNLLEIKLFNEAPVVHMNTGIRTIGIPKTQIGDSLNKCEANKQEYKNFLNTCPGVINYTIDASTQCELMKCKNTALPVPDLECNDTQCICDLSKYESGPCITQCQIIKPGYLTAEINNVTNTLTCIYTQPADQNTCTKFIGGCFTSALAYCDLKNTPNICRIDNTTVPGMTYYYVKE